MNRIMALLFSVVFFCLSFCLQAAEVFPRPTMTNPAFEIPDIPEPQIGSGPVLDLAEAVSQALSGHPDLVVARERLAQARAQVSLAKAAFWPRVGAGLNYQEREFSVNSLGFGSAFSSPLMPSTMKSVLYQSAVSLDYSVYDGGQRTAQKRSAHSGIRQGNLGVELAAELRIFTVIEAFVQSLKARELLKSAFDQAVSIRGHLRQVLVRLDSGIGVKTDRLKAETRLEEAKSALLMAENALEASRIALNAAMGTSTESLPHPLAIASFPEIGENDPALAPQRDQNNLELKLAREQVAQAHQQIVLEKTQYQPKVILSGTVDRTGKEFPLKDRNWTVSSSLQWNAFDGRARDARVREASHRFKEKEAELKSVQLGLQTRWKNAGLDLRTARNNVKVCAKALELAREELRLSLLQFEAGVITTTDLLDSQTEFTRAEINAIIARYDLILHRLRLFQLLGNLTSLFVPTPETPHER